MSDLLDSISSVHYVESAKKTKDSGENVSTGTFLKLIVAQMQYQDPLEPQSNADFVAQLAQMNSLTQMQLMNSSLGASKAIGIVGQSIYAEILNSKTGMIDVYYGTVESVVMKNDTAYVVVDGYAIAIDDIMAVGSAAEKAASTAPATDTDKSAAATDTGTVATAGQDDSADTGTDATKTE